MSDAAPRNGKLCLTDHHARLAVLESLVVREVQNLKERMDLKFDAAREAITIAAEASASALNLQYGITEKHLKDLNGEAERLRVMQASYVPREVFESKHEEVAKGVRGLELFQSNLLGKMAIAGLIGGAVASGATALIVRWISQ